jgi:hypothetical protein
MARLADAFRSLLSFCITPCCPETVTLLESKHPYAEAPLLQEAIGVPQFEGIVDQTYEAIRSFPKGPAPGTDGLRVQHLLDIMASLTEEDRDTFLTALKILTHMFQKVCFIAQYPSSGSLTA